jgi:glycosyltransferase involved in cell wall biosynthesis
MKVNLEQLPQPPINKIGFPWTEGTPPQYFDQNLPKITIITPSYNQGHYIEETIRSVLLQGYPNLEYIIIDGGSTDKTVEIIKKYELWITYWVSEGDEGQSDAINKGLKIATGDIFNWLNSDDVYLPNALLTVGLFFKANDDCHVLGGREIRRIEGGVQWYCEGFDLYTTLEETIAFARVTNLPTFFKTDILKSIGYLRKNFHLSMDTDWWVRYLVKYGLSNVSKVENVFDIFRIHAQGKSSNFKIYSHQDRYNILVGLAKNLKTINFPKKGIFDNKRFLIDTNINYDLSTLVDEKKLATYLAEHFLNHFSQYLTWQSAINLFLFSLKLKPLKRSIRFYLFLIVKFKRIFKPI